nr:ParM/StbA family protein [uncultured Roseateles sp.]
MSRAVIGLDVGRSAVKVVANVNGVMHRLTFPSLVAPNRDFSDDEAERRAGLDRIEVDGLTFLVGDSVRLQVGQGGSVGLSHDWTNRIEYRALVASAIKRLRLQAHIGEDPLIVVGTPAQNFRATREQLKAATAATVQGEVKVLMQPTGAYFAHVLSSTGVPQISLLERNGRKSNWAVVEIGHYTTDILLMRENVAVEDAIGSAEGVVEAAKSVVAKLAARGVTTNTLAAEEALQTREVRYNGWIDVGAEVDAAVSELGQKIMSTADALLARHVAEVDGVLLAGGGAPLFFPVMKARWPHTMVLPEPRQAVAEGFCRFGVGMVRRDAARAEKQRA